MTLSGSSVEMLVDLVEITMQIMAEDAPHEQRTIAMLCTCRKELIAISREITPATAYTEPSSIGRDEADAS